MLVSMPHSTLLMNNVKKSKRKCGIIKQIKKRLAIPFFTASHC